MQPRLQHWIAALLLASVAHIGIARWLQLPDSGAAGSGADGIEISLALAPADNAADNADEAVTQQTKYPQALSEPAPPASEVKQPETANPPSAEVIPEPVKPKPKPGRPKAPAKSVAEPKKSQPPTPAIQTPGEPQKTQQAVRPQTTRKPDKAKQKPAKPPGNEDRTGKSASQTGRQPGPATSAAAAAGTDQTSATDARRAYLARISAWLNRHKRYPRQAQRRGQQGTVKVRFVVDRNGRVLTAEIVASPGYPLLEQATLELLQRAAPLPPLPAELPARLEIIWPAGFYLR
jgi:protein TonB